MLVLYKHVNGILTFRINALSNEKTDHVSFNIEIILERNIF